MNTTTFVIIVLCVTGFFNLMTPFIVKTPNFISALLFQVIPFFTGLACVIAVLLLTGIFTVK